MKKIFTIALIIIFMPLMACGAGEGHPDSSCADTFVSPVYDEVIEMYRNSPAVGGIPYIGDSVTYACGEFYPEFFTEGRINRGIPGSGMTDFIGLAEEIINAENPNYVVLLLPVTDAIQGREHCIPYDLETLRETLDAPLYTLSIPVGLPTYDGLHYDRAGCMAILNQWVN